MPTPNNKKLIRILTILIAAVWLVNGLLCKVANLVPRHEEIVGRILSDEHARLLTILIGLSEVLMAIWILSGFKSRINSILQIVVIASMNVLEFLLVPDILLWGKLNICFAVLFMIIIYYKEFVLKRGVIASN